MQCACPECGILMGWRLRGIQSECRCPECGHSCDACLGTNCVLSAQQLREMADRWEGPQDEQ